MTVKAKPIAATHSKWGSDNKIKFFIDGQEYAFLISDLNLETLKHEPNYFVANIIVRAVAEDYEGDFDDN